MRHAISLTLILPLALAGCGSTPNAAREAPGAAAQATGLKSQQERITESAVLGDRKGIDALQQRLRKLNEAGVLQNNYSLAKAQCWLDTAKTQYHENDRTGYVEESITESQKIIQALEANKAVKTGYDTPLVARSARLRDDLWAELTKFKNNDTTLACTAQTVACAEVRLVRAGHAQEQTGWRAATPHVMMVEDGIRRANQQAASCAPPPAAPRAAAPVAPVAPVAVAPRPAPAPAPVVTQAAPVQTLTRESFVLLGDTLFKYNKSGISDMLPGGIERLNGIAQRLKSYQSISTLRVAGHTDRIGSDAYNDELSSRRALSVQTYLATQGIRAERVEVIGRGKNEPVSNCSTKAPLPQQIQCLQPDRRVNIDVTGMVR